MALRIGASIRPPKGAGVHASPMISVVTPCVILERHCGSSISGRIECDWMSMKPGRHDHPRRVHHLARVLRRAVWPAGATAATRSPTIATSP